MVAMWAAGKVPVPKLWVGGWACVQPIEEPDVSQDVSEASQKPGPAGRWETCPASTYAILVTSLLYSYCAFWEGVALRVGPSGMLDHFQKLFGRSIHH